MAYNPTNWQDGVTPVDASNLNKLEEAVSENSSLIDLLNGAQISYYTVNAEASRSIEYGSYCMLFVFRSGTLGIYAADQWSTINTAVSKSNIAATCESKVVTVANNTSGYVAMVALIK